MNAAILNYNNNIRDLLKDLIMSIGVESPMAILADGSN